MSELAILYILVPFLIVLGSFCIPSDKNRELSSLSNIIDKKLGKNYLNSFYEWSEEDIKELSALIIRGKTIDPGAFNLEQRILDGIMRDYKELENKR